MFGGGGERGEEGREKRREPGANGTTQFGEGKREDVIDVDIENGGITVDPGVAEGEGGRNGEDNSEKGCANKIVVRHNINGGLNEFILIIIIFHISP